jgi:hypothetical protein
MDRWLSIVLVGLGGLAIVACGGNGSDGPRGGGGTGGVMLDCSTLTNRPDDCDKACASDSECVASYCENNTKCVAHCTAEEGCGEDASCNVSGRCVPNMGTGGTGNTGGGNSCQSVQITPTRSIPNVMFLVDQSGSMTAGFSGGDDRWEAAHGAITGIVDSLDSVVRFGLTTYTSDNGNVNLPCPRLPTQVDFALGNSTDISNPSIYPPSYPSNDGADTPTGDSIDALMSIIQNAPPPADGPTIIVVATDGEPDTCEEANPQNGQAEAVAAATGAHAAGVDVFILSVGDEVGASHLQDMANVGVGLAENGSEGDAPYWVGNNPQELEDAFTEIIGASISCDIQMDKRFDDEVKACEEGDVRLNGAPLSCPSEWRVKPGADDVIELVGDACTTFKTEASTFSATFPCGAIIVE